MSLMFTCNFCGETIADDVPYVTLNGNGDRSQELLALGLRRPLPHRSRGRLLGPDPRCGSPVDAPRLDAIPTASHQAIAARRRKHRPLRPNDGATPAA